MEKWGDIQAGSRETASVEARQEEVQALVMEKGASAVGPEADHSEYPSS